RVLAVTFPREQVEAEGILQPASHGFSFAIDETPDGLPSIDTVIVSGPFNPGGPGNTDSRRKIFVCTPAAGKDEEPCARQILSTTARRAYRRPLTEKDVETLVEFYRRERRAPSRDGSFESGIQMAVERVLVDPDFLFRFERDPAGGAPSAAYKLGDLELASR